MSSTAFASRIAALRREKKISQKEAASQLGISQSLLSHYEKGIRECGLGFLRAAADFYDVTTDYLLGRSNIKSGFDLNNLTSQTLNDDTNFSTLTSYRASAYVFESMIRLDRSQPDGLLVLYSVALYKNLLMAVENHRLPLGWVQYKKAIGNPQFRHIIDSFEASLSAKSKLPISEKSESDEIAPLAVRTIEKVVIQMIMGEFNREMTDIMSNDTAEASTVDEETETGEKE